MTSSVAVNAISTCLSILGLSILIFWGLRTLAVDWFRDKMFTLRDSFFDEAAAGLVDFNHPAYGMLRQTMNGYIRFCHKMSMLFVLISASLTYIDKDNYPLFDKNWTNVTRDLSGKTLRRVNIYRQKMELLVISYLIISSPFISVLLFIGVLLGFTVKKVGSLRETFVVKWATQLRQSKRFQPIMQDIDDTAYASGIM